MKNLLYIFILFPFLSFGQIVEKVQDSTEYEYFVVEGDTIHKDAIDLDEIKLFNKLEFKDKNERIRYLILKRKTKKVYPYAKLAADRLISLNERLESMTKKRHRRKYAKRIEKYIEDEFSAELKKLTRTEGQILVKLIHRQTGNTTFELVKELRSGWKAFWYQNTAKLFKISLKKEFDPVTVEEDFLIEDILQREFQVGNLEKQKPAMEFDYFDLVVEWNNKQHE
ncbi:MAG: DUF4294 domain-containing protein [Flavobacteriaceae bacterium]|nr:DUF4294 domain-containing protein [Bacteroidia bacterium]NNL15600.1 DUF4294 domain-containing protein [Flavobacteriaceae bacterium]